MCFAASARLCVISAVRRYLGHGGAPLLASESCRTAVLGGHVERCGDCGHQRVSCNSCRDRNCPKCQGPARAQWLQDRQAELLDVPYFEVVFTMPSQIEVIAFQNQTIAYGILFRAASETLRTIAADPEHPGVEIGFLGVLHTWGQHLMDHRHIDFLAPGRGIAPDGQSWIPCRPGSSSRCGCCRVCFGDCSCGISKKHSPSASSASSPNIATRRSWQHSGAT